MWRLIQQHAKRIGVNAMQCANMLLIHIEALAYDDSLSWLPPDWQHTHKEQRKSAANLPTSLLNVDLTVLHRSTSTKSGYVGVYANGKGFRAVGRKSAYLGTFDSAEEAAFKRYLVYKQNKLPYGELEIEVDKRRAFGDQGTDQELAEQILQFARENNQMHIYGPWVPKDSSTEPSSNQPKAQATPKKRVAKEMRPQEMLGETAGQTTTQYPGMLGFEDTSFEAMKAKLDAFDAENEILERQPFVIEKRSRNAPSIEPDDED